MRYIIFKNPEILHREEKFGGLIKLKYQIFILGKKEYSFFKKFKKYVYYDSLENEEKMIVDKFLREGIFVDIEESKAKKVIEKFKK